MHIRDGLLIVFNNLVFSKKKKKGDEMRRNSLMENGCNAFLAVVSQQGFCWLSI